MNVLHLPTAFGDAIDKITILQIKLERITDPGKQQNVKSELALVSKALFEATEPTPELDILVGKIRAVNAKL